MKKLLIVDDDRHLLDSLREVFSGTYEVTAALSAEEAGPLLKQHPDAVLLDVILPGQNGVAFLQEINSACPGLPVIMISGASSIRPVIEALNAGAVDYVRKPFDIDELRLVVGRALKHAELKQRLQEMEAKLALCPVPDGGKPLKQAVEDYERVMIKQALRHAGGVQTHAAKELGTTRRILRYRMEKLNIK